MSFWFLKYLVLSLAPKSSYTLFLKDRIFSPTHQQSNSYYSLYLPAKALAFSAAAKSLQSCPTLCPTP